MDKTHSREQCPELGQDRMPHLLQGQLGPNRADDAPDRAGRIVARARILAASKQRVQRLQHAPCSYINSVGVPCYMHLMLAI